MEAMPPTGGPPRWHDADVLWPSKDISTKDVRDPRFHPCRKTHTCLIPPALLCAACLESSPPQPRCSSDIPVCIHQVGGRCTNATWQLGQLLPQCPACLSASAPQSAKLTISKPLESRAPTALLKFP
eukprot:836212-Karenia_brevis.AAC.1